jgi:hypothetical protein
MVSPENGEALMGFRAVFEGDSASLRKRFNMPVVNRVDAAARVTMLHRAPLK